MSQGRRDIATRLVGVGILIAGALLAAGCGSVASTVDESSGRTVAYTPGLPNFDMEAISTLREQSTGFDLYIGIPRASLVFLKRGDYYVARFEGIIQLLDQESKTAVIEKAWRDTVVANTFEETQSYETVLFERRVQVEPGQYIVRCGIQDQTSQKLAVRVQALEVFEVDASRAGLSRVRLEGKEGDSSFTPLVALHIPASVDSLRALVELYNAPSDGPVDVEMTLLRYRSDDSIANQPYWISPMMGSLGYRGVDYRRSDVIQRSTRTLPGVADEVLLEFLIPSLDRGVYRIDVKVTVPRDDGSEEVVLEQYRDLSVKSADFPHVARLEQLVDALAYIAHDKEIEEIRTAPTRDEMRQRFDAFWGSLVANRQVAGNLVKQYYERIEEANLLFTSHKEGWKTDRGMVYTVLGAPMYVEYQFDTEIWYYSYSDRDPLHTFVFRRVRMLKGEETFQNFILSRRPYYERTWSRAVSRWRDGSVL